MTRVVIIGAGIVGAAIAEALTRRGATVSIIDRDKPGQGTTATSLAWFNANDRHPRSYHDLAVAAIQEWAAVAARYDRHPWYQKTGNLTWVESDVDRERLSERVARLHQIGYPAEQLTHCQASILEPELVIPSSADIVFFPAEGYIEGADAVAAFIASARAAGAEVIENDAAQEFIRTDGQINGVRLTSGRTVYGDLYVTCAGWRTPQLLASIDVTVPLLPAHGTKAKSPCLVATVATQHPVVRRVVHTPLVKIRPKGADAVQLEASDINAQTDLETHEDDLTRLATQLLSRARRVLPALAGSALRDRTVCIRPMPVDGFPIIGRVRELSNLYLATTHSGVTLAPLLARLLSSELLGGEPAPLLRPYHPHRFSNASDA